ncbi:chemotaxis protein CheA [Virgibacillus pantothenticus]|uniref:chemotaxis protein CheA n=1 Tax=Virgibacillus pantothenticus TaxID=1473 RepID=UPI001B0886BB|nr:chemotaxis protein CheA [Virgibacillus pantothenticus]GIP62067.1 chemotaxis protein CheA [Virgibacillus pantothenticus]
MDTSGYLTVFIDESNEHLEVLYNQLLALEKQPEETAIIEEIFRAAHTLKGMSATMGYHDLASLTHKLENVFDAIKEGKISVQSEMIDVLFAAVDYLHEMVEDISAGGNGSKDVTDVVEQLKCLEQGETLPHEKPQLEASQEPAVHSQQMKNIDEFAMTILQESKERGYTNYEISITLKEDCLLKGARVFMIFEVLEKLGEIVKSDPSVTELEEEQFDHTFTVLFISEHKKETIQINIEKVSEIEAAEIVPFNIEQHQEKEQDSRKLAENQGTTKVKETKQRSSKGVANKTIRVNIDRLDVLMNLFEELVVDRGRLEQLAADLDNKDLQDTVEHMSRVSSDLQSIILTMRMVPIEQVFNRFPRMIRQVARELNKQVEVEIIGAETELDRTVIDEIGDPLVHLIRNAIDHGIEAKEARINKGKPEYGTLKLEAYHSGNHVFIEIEDDGAGIHKEKVLNKAISKGVISEGQAELLSDQQIFELIMSSGFSTADQVSDISGRGVGLDVVKNTIESLGGKITIDSKQDRGSVFSIQLPLTLSIISVLLIELQKEKYAIPLSSIIETAIVHQDEVMHAHHTKVIDFRGKVVPLAFLNDIFAVKQPADAETNAYLSIVIVKKGNKMVGLVVDSFIGQQEVVLKSLGNYLTNTFAISGATILGDGEVALIIDSNALVK